MEFSQKQDNFQFGTILQYLEKLVVRKKFFDWNFFDRRLSKGNDIDFALFLFFQRQKFQKSVFYYELQQWQRKHLEILVKSR